MTTATIVTATVKYAAGPPRETKYGKQRINALLTLPDGSEDRVWGDPGDAAITALSKGDTVQVLQDGKGLKLVQVPQQPSSPTPAPQHTQGHGAPEDSEAAFDEALQRASRRICKAIRNAKVVAEREYGITEGMIQADVAAAAIVKETACALLIEAGKLLG